MKKLNFVWMFFVLFPFLSFSNSQVDDKNEDIATIETNIKSQSIDSLYHLKCFEFEKRTTVKGGNIAIAPSLLFLFIGNN